MEKSSGLPKPMTCLLKKDWSENLKKLTITRYLKSGMPFLDLRISRNAVSSLFRRGMSGRGGADMEVKINKEIRNYTESMFFGLSMRQFLFSVLACGVAVGLFFLLRGRFGTETLSWMCILGASPFAVMGFVRYNGMTAEQFVWAWIKSEFIMPKKLLFVPENLYYEAMKNAIEAHEKGTPAVQKKRKKRKRRAKRRKEARKRRKQAEKARKQNKKARKRKEADYD